MSMPIASAPPPGPDPVAAALLTSFPRGRLSEIVGPRSSGGTSLLMALLARTTAAGALAAVIDAADALDPASAREAGVDLRLLLWVRCGGRLPLALRAADLIARCPGFGVVAVDLGVERIGRVPHTVLVRLQRAVETGGGVLVVRALQHVAGSAAGLVVSSAAVRVSWAGGGRPTHLDGLICQAQVAHARGVAPGEGARWILAFSAPGSQPVRPAEWTGA